VQARGGGVLLLEATEFGELEAFVPVAGLVLTFEEDGGEAALQGEQPLAAL